MGQEQRLALHQVLVALLGSEHVYFQPPENVLMEYPCIRYRLDDDNVKHANNALYLRKKRYQATYIDRAPDETVPDKLALLPLCAFDRFYTAANLNHYVYNIFF